ncbi:hypothetical protein [Helicobacter sp. T3_23-1056]
MQYSKCAKKVAFVALVSSAFIVGSIFSGCALTSNGTKQSVTITTSNGKPVLAEVDGQKINIPAEIKISRKHGATIRVLEMDNPNYEDTLLIIKGKHNVSGWFWGNILSMGTFGSTTDGASGSMWTYGNPTFIVPVSEKK